MKTVQLKSMRIQNFGNIRDLAIEFGNKTFIKGKNESGKTTIGDAYSWLMTNRLMSGRQSDGIRPIKNGVQEDFVDIVVEATFDIDGRNVVIQKTQSQKWTKKTGKFEGNINKYMINDIPKKEKEYKEYIDQNIMKPEQLEQCTSAAALLKLDTTKRRKVLFDLVQEFSDEDVIATDEKFELIRSMLLDGSIEELISRVKYQVNGRNKNDKGLQGKLDEFPARIDEVSKKIADVAEFELAIRGLKVELNKLDEQERDLNDLISAYDQKSKDILELKDEQSEIVRKANEGIISRKKRLNEDIILLEQEKRNTENDLRMAEIDLKHADMAIECNTAELEKYQKDWEEYSVKEYPEENLEAIKTETFDENSLICPTCKQNFPEAEADKIRSDFEKKKAERIKKEEKAKAAFYKTRDKMLEDIAEALNKASTGLKRAKKVKTEAEERIAEFNKTITELAEKIAEKEMEFSQLPASVDMTENAEYQKITAEIAQAENALRHMANGSEQRRKIKSERDRIVSEISSYQAQIKASHEAQERVDELETQRREIAQKLANCQMELDLLKDFQKKKCEMLTEKVNALFTYTKWVLFKFNTGDDGYQEICEPSYKGVKYNERLNHGGRSLIDLDICNTFQENCNVSVPIWCDDADGLTSNTLEKMDAFGKQVIYIVADEGVLRLEQV